MALLRPTIWTQQPQVPVEIDWSNPITRDLIFAVSGVGPDAVSGQQGFALPSGKQGITKNGVAVESTSTTDGGYYYPLSKHIPDSLGDVTLFQVVEIDSWGAYSALFSIPIASSTWAAPYGAIGIQQDGSNNKVRLWGTSGAAPATANETVAPGNAYSIGVAKSGSSAIFDINGIRESASLTPVVYDLSARQPICLLQRSNSNNGEAVDGRSAITLLWKRALSADELKSIRENPWQIFAPRSSRRLISAGGGSVNANASGALSVLSVAAPTASASGSAFATGALAAITIYAPTATASAGGSAAASGSFAALSISPATATATATTSATASGSFATISLSAPTATATGTTAGGANATGTPAQITISHAAAIAIGSAVASGGYQSIGITAPTGSASVGNGNATASGTWAAISITAPTACASSGFIRAPAGSGPTVIQPGSYRPSNTGGRRY